MHGYETWSMNSRSLSISNGVVIVRDYAVTVWVESYRESDYLAPDRAYNTPGHSESEEWVNENPRPQYGDLPVFKYNNFRRDNGEHENISFLAPDGKHYDFPPEVAKMIESQDPLAYYKKNTRVKIRNKRTHHVVEIDGRELDILDSRKSFSLKPHMDKGFKELQANTEVLRAMCEYRGYEWLCNLIGGTIADEDIDQYNNPVRLWKGHMEMPEYSANKFMDMKFVDVTCPSTNRRYFIPVAPEAKNVWDGIAQTFKMNENKYKPLIES